jgi:fermentation-respiration switch protein FrsA (DUF1100 family)
MIEVVPVVFEGPHGILAGRVHRCGPARGPAVIVAGSWLTVKEQMAAVYAGELAARGFHAFTFDFTGFGESQGTPRQLELPLRKMADFIAAADFLSTQSFVESVGGLAVCASAQYMLGAVARGARIRAVASVAGWFHDTNALAGFYGGDAGIARRRKEAGAAAQKYLATGEVEMVPAYENGNDRAGMFFELEYYASGKRGAVPAWKNQMAVMSWFHWLGFDGVNAGRDARVPTLFVHSDGCVFPDTVKALHGARGGESELVWLDGTQTDYYDLPPFVKRAADAAERFFARTLRG